MRFEQAHEILEHIRDHHASLSDCYQHLQDRTAPYVRPVIGLPP